MNEKDISAEKWRTYTWTDPVTKEPRYCTITHPLKLYYTKGSSCHVVTGLSNMGEGPAIAYCVPAIGYFGCYLTWGKITGRDLVDFVSASKPVPKK